MRPFSTRSPSADRIAGSTVSEPIMATATTSIVPIAKDMKVLSPEKNMPAIAIITVKPEISTARPEVAAAASSAARSAASGAALVSLAAHVEERVVDSDGQADQQDDLGDLLVHRDDLARAVRPGRAWRAPGQPERDRHERRGQRPDDQQQDEDRERDGDQAGPGELRADERPGGPSRSRRRPRRRRSRDGPSGRRRPRRRCRRCSAAASS